MKAPITETITLEKIVGGGQTLGTLQDGRKAFVWGALPGETAVVRVTKKKSRLVEGTATQIIQKSKERVLPKDPATYLSTSPWQIMDFNAEQHYKSALIEEAFELHDIVLPDKIDVFTDGEQYGYRNKVEFSWHSAATENGDTLDLAFYVRASKGKVMVDRCALLPKPMMDLALRVRDLLHARHVSARQLKTLLIRCDQKGACVWQLYVKDEQFGSLDEQSTAKLPAQGGEVIYSDPKSPASRITKRLQAFGDVVLSDTVLGVPFRYATEGFFQINLPVYEQALKDMQKYITPGKPVVDLYSGVGSIGLTIGGDSPELIEINEDAVREMERNIDALHSNATAVLSSSEQAVEYITSNKFVIVDPPRAGLHKDVIDRLLAELPERIIYLSCNPVSQARDVSLLAASYGIRAHRGYNFFPRTPHIEHLVILDKR